MKLVLTENKKFLKVVDCTETEYAQLKLSLTKKIKNWRFHPLVKRGLWNGEISFIKGNMIPSGLWGEVKSICERYKFQLNLQGVTRLFDTSVSTEEFLAWVGEHFKDHKVQPRDYQIESAIRILKYRRCLAELATSAGKSLILYMVVAYLLETNRAERLLLIVPNVGLVIQAAEDFDDYNQFERITLKIQQIYSGAKIKNSSNIVIGTYQSLIKKTDQKSKSYNPDFFNEFDAVMVDETHKAKAASIKTILEYCGHCDYKFGVSGTIPTEGTVDRLTILSNTGPVVTEINANYLIQRGFITPCEVKMLYLNYAIPDQREAFYSLSKTPEDRKKLFTLEQNFVRSNAKRLKFLNDMFCKFSKNSLILFHHQDLGQALYKNLRNTYDGEVYYVDGNTNSDVRERYKAKMEEGTNKILVASFGTFSTGISINNIHMVAFTESFKSDVIIRQSIGRGLRKHKTKDKVIILDFVDDLRYSEKDGSIWKNYLYKHGDVRKGIYDEQKFPVTKKTFNF